VHISELDTPFMVVDLDILEDNITRLEDYLHSIGVRGRPHIKTHKIPAIARKQIAAGAIGITCQKVTEAEVFAAAGFDDILIPYNIVGRPKIERLIRLQYQSRVMAAVDAADTARAIGAIAVEERATVPLVVELDAGGHRAGTQTAIEAVDIARAIASTDGLTFEGLMCYPTSQSVIPILLETCERLDRAGLTPRVISGGGTGVHEVAREAGLTEHRSGTYSYSDLNCVRACKATIEQCAMQVLVTVVSTASPGHATVDGGSKTFTNDSLQPDGRNGYVMEYPDVYLERMNEEHGILNTSHSASQPKVGEKLRIIPNHACGTTNLHDFVAAHRNGTIEAIWPIAARGTIH